jgi:hypothetical protein
MSTTVYEVEVELPNGGGASGSFSNMQAVRAFYRVLVNAHPGAKLTPHVMRVERTAVGLHED